jgi:hypothetical protein
MATFIIDTLGKKKSNRKSDFIHYMYIESLIPNIKTASTSARNTSKLIGGLKPFSSSPKTVSIIL